MNDFFVKFLSSFQRNVKTINKKNMKRLSVTKFDTNLNKNKMQKGLSKVYLN